MKKAIAVVAASVLLPATAMAGSPDLNSKAVANLKNVTMTVTGPDGYLQSSNSTNTSTIMSSSNGAPLADGVYSWELKGNTGKKIVTAKNFMDNGRGDAQRSYSYETVTYSGSYTIKNGVRVDSSLEEK